MNKNLFSTSVQFVRMLPMLLAFVFLSGCEKQQAEPKVAAAPVTTDATTSSFPYIGTLGSSTDDQLVRSIVTNLSGFWGKETRRVVITTNASIPNFAVNCDRSIYINKAFYQRLKSLYNDRTFRLILRGILAHEFGHILQLAYVNDRSVYRSNSYELEADFLAGSYLGHIWGANYNRTSLTGFLTFYADTRLQLTQVPITCLDPNPGYGSRCQRDAAARAGWNFGQRYNGPLVGGGKPVPAFDRFRNPLVKGAILSCTVPIIPTR